MKTLLSCLILCCITNSLLSQKIWERFSDFKGASYIYIDKEIMLVSAILPSFLYLSRDSGRTFLPIKGTENLSLVVDIKRNGDSLYILDMYSGLYKSGLDGSGARPIYNDNNNLYNCLLFVGNHLFMGTWSGMFKSTDLGKTWHSVPELNREYVFSISNFPNSNQFVLASTFEKGLYGSEDSGTSWNEYQNAITEIDVLSPLTLSKKFLYTSYSSGLSYSDNFYKRWDCMDLSGIKNRDEDIKTLNVEDSLVFITIDQNRFYGFLSLDNGHKWIDVAYNLKDTMNSEFVNYTLINGNSIYLCSNAFGIVKLNITSFLLKDNNIEEAMDYYYDQMTKTVSIKGIRQGRFQLFDLNGKIADSGYFWDDKIHLKNSGSGIYFLNIEDELKRNYKVKIFNNY